MFIEFVLSVVLIFSTLLCSLVAGFVLLFAIVVMPGIGSLGNRDFLRAFQVVDKVIQDNQPVFLFVWLGSAATLVVAAVLGFWQLDGAPRALIVVATALYLLGVQLPTIAINIPLNNRVQSLDLDTLDEKSLADERQVFEPRWNRWNVIRTVVSCVVSVLLLIALQLT